MEIPSYATTKNLYRLSQMNLPLQIERFIGCTSAWNLMSIILMGNKP